MYLVKVLVGLRKFSDIITSPKPSDFFGCRKLFADGFQVVN